MIALLDLDIITYRCGFAVEKNKYLIYIKGDEHFGPVAVYKYKRDIPDYYSKDEGCFIVKEKTVEPVENALHGVKETLQSIIEAVGASSYKGYLSGEGNFRDTISVTKKYKGNRNPEHKPAHYNDIRDYLINYWKAEVVDGMEADDALGIKQDKYGGFGFNENAYEKTYNTIICSIDKDLDQIPGWHYNFVKKEKYFIEEEQAIRTFYTQLLVGDNTDNIQGVKGIGPAKAAKILSECKNEKEMYEACVKAYDNQELLNEMAQLVYIRRKEGVEWKPPYEPH